MTLIEEDLALAYPGRVRRQPGSLIGHVPYDYYKVVYTAYAVFLRTARRVPPVNFGSHRQPGFNHRLGQLTHEFERSRLLGEQQLDRREYAALGPAEQSHRYLAGIAELIRVVAAKVEDPHAENMDALRDCWRYSFGQDPIWLHPANATETDVFMRWPLDDDIYNGLRPDERVKIFEFWQQKLVKRLRRGYEAPFRPADEDPHSGTTAYHALARSIHACRPAVLYSRW